MNIRGEHAIERLKERFGIVAEPSDLDDLARAALEDGVLLRIVQRGNRYAEVRAVKWRGASIVALVRPSDSFVVTVGESKHFARKGKKRARKLAPKGNLYSRQTKHKKGVGDDR